MADEKYRSIVKLDFQYAHRYPSFIDGAIIAQESM